MKKNFPKIWRWLLAALALLVLGAGVKVYFFPAADTPRFLTAKAAVADLEDTVLATGELKASKLVSVGSRASGQVKSLKVELGDEVAKGQLIAEIDSLTQQNDLKTAQAALKNVQAQLRGKRATLRQAEASLARKKLLADKDAGSRQDYEDALATREVTKEEIAALEAQLEEAKVNVSNAEVNLGYTKITAPMDGVVVAIITKEGQTVNASQSAPTIVMLAQLNVMTVEAEISEADVVRVKPGQKVYFTILGQPDQRYYASLRAIEPAPESITEEDSNSSSGGSSATSSSSSAIYYNGLFDVPNQDGRLRIYMTAQCTIVVAEAQKAVSIPSSALGSRDSRGRYLVRVLGAGNRPADRWVAVGINDSNQAQVLEGIREGEQVVIGEADAANQESQGRRPPPMGL
ncbi:hemolysin secretion protein D [Desulfocarbo indianensis]|nr:hemolysin secretion protein D [Desulfocarbo indianensis]